MRIIGWILAAGLALAGLPAGAETHDLRLLDTMDAARGWEGVGRLDLNGTGFCTGALIAPDLVLTAGHCLYDKRSRTRIDHKGIEFLAGWRNGRAVAYRSVRRAVVHPGYTYDPDLTVTRVRNDLALLELDQPIRNTSVTPFGIAGRPRTGDEVGIVSYARDRSEAPSLEELCDVMSRQDGVLVMTCSVDFGSSGAPIFTFTGGVPRIVSVVAAKAELEGHDVALGTSLEEPLEVLKAELAAGKGYGLAQVTPQINRIGVGEGRDGTGAKFVRP